MRPVEQQISAVGNGDCFRACLESITEIDGVPNLIENEQWFTDTFVWLGEHGWEMYTRPKERPPTGYAIGVLWSPTFEGERHAVVVHDGALAWDPSPKRDEPDRTYGEWLYFVEVRPVRAAAGATS